MLSIEIGCKSRGGNGRSHSREQQRTRTRVEGQRLAMTPCRTPTFRLHVTKVNIAAWLIGRCNVRACLAPGRRDAHTNARKRRRVRRGLLSLQRERGKRSLGARSHKVNYCGVHTAETRLPRERGRVKVLYGRAFLSRITRPRWRRCASATRFMILRESSERERYWIIISLATIKKKHVIIRLIIVHVCLHSIS